MAARSSAQRHRQEQQGQLDTRANPNGGCYELITNHRCQIACLIGVGMHTVMLDSYHWDSWFRASATALCKSTAASQAAMVARRSYSAVTRAFRDSPGIFHHHPRVLCMLAQILCR